MNKTAAGLGVLGLGATASVAAPLAMTLSGGTNGGVMEEGNTSPSPELVSESISRPNWKGTKIPSLTKSSDIKNKYRQIECLKDYFKGGEGWNDSDRDYENAEPSFGFAGQENDVTKSCLIVEYYKQEQDGKWWGEFKLVWSLSEQGDQEGLITVFNAKTEDGKLKTDSSIYVIEKGGNDNKKILANHKQESVLKDITDDNGLSEYFPKSNTSTKDGGDDDYWGFATNINNICKDNECPEITGNGKGTTTSKRWTWNSNGSNSEIITSWSSNFDTWFNKLLENKWSKIKEALGKMKGNWSKQN